MPKLPYSVPSIFVFEFNGSIFRCNTERGSSMMVERKKKKKDKNQKNVLVCVCREAKKTAITSEKRENESPTTLVYNNKNFTS